MIGLKVIMGDPSELTGGDAFAWVGAQLKLDGSNTIEFKLAKQFWNDSFDTVARWARKKHNIIRPNFMGMEVNRRIDKKIHKLFRTKYKMEYLQGVTTSSNLTEKTRQMGYTMDKPFMVHWLNDKIKDHEIIFPQFPTKDMQELIDQVPKIVELKTVGGQSTYKAQRGQHDDLFTAGLHCCNFIRLFIEQQERLK